MPRLFYAIEVEPTPALSEVMATLRGAGTVRVEGVRGVVRLRVVKEAQLHLTLRFLGEMPEGRVPELGEALARAVQSAGIGLLQLAFDGVGTFDGGRRRPPRVIFADLVDASPLQRLERALSDELAALTPPVPRERRPYHPHLTLARVSPGRGEPRAELGTLLAPFRDAPLGEVTVDAVHLIESRLSPRGADYVRRFSASLSP